MNIKYVFLKDLNWLYKQLQTKTMAELALEIYTTNPEGIKSPASLAASIRYQVQKNFGHSKELMSKIKQGRAFHKNSKV